MTTNFRVLAPALLTFGPLFLAMPSPNLVFVPYLGAMMLAWGLGLVIHVLHSQHREIESLRASLEAGGPAAT